MVSASCPNLDTHIHLCSRKDLNAMSSATCLCVRDVIIGGCCQARLSELFQQSLSTLKNNFIHRHYFLMKFFYESVLRTELTHYTYGSKETLDSKMTGFYEVVFSLYFTEFELFSDCYTPHYKIHA